MQYMSHFYQIMTPEHFSSWMFYPVYFDAQNLRLLVFSKTTKDTADLKISSIYYASGNH